MKVKFDDCNDMTHYHIHDFEELSEKIKKQNILLLDDILGWLSRILKIGLVKGEFNFSVCRYTCRISS